MEFLPYHFLLATLGISSNLKYQDVATGQMVSEIHTKGGAPCSMTQNPWNAICHIGHQNGTVSLWSPNSSDPLVKLLAHKGPVRSLAVDREGRYMVSAGQDMKMAVWDIRMFKEVNSYFTRTPAKSVAISDTGLTAVVSSKLLISITEAMLTMPSRAGARVQRYGRGSFQNTRLYKRRCKAHT